MDKRLEITICGCLAGLIFCAEVLPLLGHCAGDAGRNHHIGDHFLIKPEKPNCGLFFVIPQIANFLFSIARKSVIGVETTCPFNYLVSHNSR